MTMGGDRVRVLLPLPFDKGFDYLLPEGLGSIELGTFVGVNFGGAYYVGIVWEHISEPFEAGIKYKAIKNVFDCPLMSETLRNYLTYVSRYYVFPLGLAVKLAFTGVGNRKDFDKLRTQITYALSDKELGKVSLKQQQVLDILAEHDSLPMQELLALSGVGAGVVRNLLSSGFIVRGEVGVLPSARDLTLGGGVVDGVASPTLSRVQESVMLGMDEVVSGGVFSVLSLQGVTGSGKSEVYFHLIESVLSRGKNVLVLLPEIALTQQWQKQFLGRFSEPPILWHSSLTASVRRRTWQAVIHERVRFLVGARSCLFLPLDNLGLVVVDEEHDSGYKQEDDTPYHARDMAIVRAKLSDCPIVLVSATPSLETYAHMLSGKYLGYNLPDRVGGGGDVDVSVVDLMSEPLVANRWISGALQHAIEESLLGGYQILLYLNRRGYAPLTLCRSCGYRFECPHCSVGLVEHRRTSEWLCHYCGYSLSGIRECVQCGESGDLLAYGPGVERLVEEVGLLFPDARLAEMTSDSMESSLAIESFIDSVGRGEVDIIIGTQLIAKGYHFPRLTLVGVIDADMGLGGSLGGGDLRANERSFQLLQQVSGRAGRGDYKGRVFLQTVQSGNSVIRAIADGGESDFYRAELLMREANGLPPCGRLAAVIVSGDSQEEAHSAARSYANFAHKLAPEGVQVLGPIPAPVAFLRDRYRYRLLLHCGLEVRLQGLLKKLRGKFLRASTSSSKGVHFKIDIDPINFY